jgi:putative relaxase
LKQRFYFLMENSKNFDDFLFKAEALNVQIDFSRNHARFFMTDMPMKQVIRGKQLDKRQPYTDEYFREQFAKRAIEQCLDFLLPRVSDLSQLLEFAQELNLTISLKQKNVAFTLTENGHSITVNNQKLSSKNPYDVQFFETYFEKRREVPAIDQSQLISDFEGYCEEQEKDKLDYEDLQEAYQAFKEKRDQVQEFEVVLAEHQIDKLVKDGLFIRMNYGVKKEGLVFIPNRQLDIKETESGKHYHVFIRETAQFFIYNKEASELNRYMRGRELILQLTNDSQSIPKRRRPTIDTLKKKIEEINLLIELDTENKSYQEVKDEIVKDIAQLDLTITGLQDHIAHLNKVVEVLLNLNNNDIENRRLARYDYAKMNLTAAIKIEEVEKEIGTCQNELNQSIDDYESLVRRLESFVNLFKDTKDFSSLKALNVDFD